MIVSLEESLASEVGGDARVGVYGSTLQPVFIVLALGETPPPGEDPFELIGAEITQNTRRDRFDLLDLTPTIHDAIVS